jgi:DUF4097 and DUF4098 domain-containing protein YvlB
MKSTLIIIIFNILFVYSNAQRVVEKALAVTNNQRVELDFQFADQIIIKTWEKKEVYVKATVDINDGADNDKFRFDAFEGSSFVKIESEIEDLKKLSKKGTRIIIDGNDTIISDGCNVHMDLYFEVFMPVDCELEVETISGNIDIKGLKKEMDIHTISGDIDYTVDESAKIDISMKTITGSLYTDLDMEIRSKHRSMHQIGGDVDATFNGGGNDVELETISGNIYIRNLK